MAYRMKNCKVKGGLTLVVDLLCRSNTFVSVTSVLRMRHCRVKVGRMFVQLTPFCSGNLVVKDSTLPSCYLHILMLAGRKKPQKLVFLLS